MKIEWLNAERTEAFVTKGWFRKRQAHVRYSDRELLWRYIPSRNVVASGSWMEICLEGERRAIKLKEKTTSDWQPVERMPAARLLERK